MNEFLSNPIIQLVLAIITVTEFSIALISYLKISKVRKSQIQYRDIVELDNILRNLRENDALLSYIRSVSDMPIPEELSYRIDRAIALNHECIGSVNKANQILLKSDEKIQNSNVVYHEKGYFNNEFYRDVILSAKRRVVLYIKRNIRPFSLDNLSALLSLADQSNVNITIFAFSPKMDNDILNEMKKSIPNCPTQTDELINTQIAGKNLFLELKQKMKKPGNFNYYEYTSFPISQYIVVDDRLYWGIVNYNKMDMVNPFEERPYLEMNVSTPFARYILSMQNKEIAECIKNGFAY